ncbi:MAG TPA: hypothetical protein VFB20_17605 [Burkholderiales bacterium]|nr:hypothetical protein [Burkholderiales bacterium]
MIRRRRTRRARRPRREPDAAPLRPMPAPPAAPRPWTMRTVRTLKLLWWALCFGVLLWWVVSIGPSHYIDAHWSGEHDERTLYGVMGFLAFPAGFVWVFALSHLEPLLHLPGWDPALLPWYARGILAWLGCALLGHLQWFVLVPHSFSMTHR